MENSELSLIQSKIQNLFRVYVPPLCISKDNEQVFEVSGTKEATQGRKKVDGYYFGSVVPKPGDIRLYYFPIYTHVKKFLWISDELRKCLKGKSCFHIKKMSPSLEVEIAKMIEVGIELYRKEELI
jgi:hypothetical protein